LPFATTEDALAGLVFRRRDPEMMPEAKITTFFTALFK
jgi:hypothetical protein